MKSVIEQLSYNAFLPHGHCYFWRPDILWLHVGSNAIITIAYLLIPGAIIIFIRNANREIPHQDILYLFIAFITFCGLSHATEIVTTWFPFYQFEGWIKAITASISMVTALVLIPKLPELLQTRGLQEKLEKTELELMAMELKLNQMSSVYQASLGREDRIVQLKIEVNKELQRQGIDQRYTIYHDKN